MSGVRRQMNWLCRVCDRLWRRVRVNGVSGFCYDRVETRMVISGVVHGSCRTIRFNETVLALHHVTISFFRLVFDVTGVSIFDAVVEVVFRVSLKTINDRIRFKLSHLC